MKIQLGFFASRRYWNDESELQSAYRELAEQFAFISSQSVLITDPSDVDGLGGGDCLVLFPMSGAVQRLVLDAADKYKTVVIFPIYMKGNSPDILSNKMLMHNAAPTLMDVWGVLKRSHEHSCFALTNPELQTCLRVLTAYIAMQGATLLLVGETEPWVVSNSENLSTYQRLGVTIKQIPQEQLAKAYHQTNESDSKDMYSYFYGDQQAIIEPTDQDLSNACRMGTALLNLIKENNADGVAIACFNLLKEGTTNCLGVSYINDCTPYIAACEGDVDSAVTMLAMKKLATSKLWMANPGLHPDGKVNFSHCTAPLDMYGSGKFPYTLRSHHESGIGASLQVDYPVKQMVTTCRISDDASKITIQMGQTEKGDYECACRTQVYVAFDDFDKYINNSLGCHQVFTFGDIKKEMQMLAHQLKLEIL